MTLTIELPNDIAEHEHVAAEALEAFAVEAYCADVLTRSQARKLLGISRYEFDGVLKRRGVMKDAYDVEAFLADVQTSDRLRAEGKLPR